MIEVWDYELTRGLHGRPLFRQCEAELVLPARYPKLGTVRERCGGTAVKGATWDGMTEGRHSAILCDRCLLRYLGPMIGQAY